MGRKLLKKMMLLGFCCLLAAALAGCTESGGQTGQTGQTASDVQVLYYFDGVISLDGEVLFMPKVNEEYLILTDQSGRQRYIMETVSTFDSEQRNEYNEAIQTACTYRIYDLQGGLQKELNVQLEGNSRDAVSYSFPQDGDLSKFRVMVNRLNSDGTFQILDLDGKVLVDEQVLADSEADEWLDRYVWLDMFGDFIQVRCSFYKYEPDYEWQESAYFYDLNGQPLELAKEYMYIYNIFDFFSDDVSGYYSGYYENAQGNGLFDILDENCQVLVSGLGEIDYCTNGRFVVTSGFERGLIDAQGNWIYREPIFIDLED